MSEDPRFSRHVTKVCPTLQELFAAGEAVDQMLTTPGWAIVQRVLNAEITEIDNDLDRATEPLTQAQYSQRHGRRDGLRGLQRAADAIVSKAAEKRAAEQAKADAESPAER